MMQNKILQNRKGPAPGDKKCYALNTSGGYISGLLEPYPEYSSLWRPVSTCTESGRLMIGLFFIGIVVSIIVMAVLLYVRKYDT